VWRSNWVKKIEDISVLRKAFYVLVKMFAKIEYVSKCVSQNIRLINEVRIWQY